MSFSGMRQNYKIRYATKKPMSLVHVQYLTKVRRSPPVQQPWAGHESDMPRLRAEAQRKCFKPQINRQVIHNNTLLNQRRK
jgi:hypothetical protein